MGNRFKTIIFDYGGVLCKPQDRNILKEMVHLAAAPDIHEFEKIYYELRGNYDQGLISGLEYWKQILEKFNTPYSEGLALKLISLDSAGWTVLNDDMIDFISELREMNYKLAVLSNMPADILDYINKKTELFSVFDNTVFSCDLKLIKPDPDIYRKCLELIDCMSGEVLFIDDREDNIKAAAAEGIKGMQYLDFSSFKEEIKAVLDN